MTSSRLRATLIFRLEAVNKAYVRDSDHHSTCPWKGVASYYSLDVDGKQNANAVWYYPTPKDAAKQIAGRCGVLEGRAGG